MTQSYSVFQTEIDQTFARGQLQRPLRALGFVGRVLEGTGIVAFTVFITIMTLTTAARADTWLADPATATGPGVTVAILAVFGIMLAMVRRTWRQTTKVIQNAPRRSHRIG